LDRADSRGPTNNVLDRGKYGNDLANTLNDLCKAIMQAVSIVTLATFNTSIQTSFNVVCTVFIKMA